MIDNRHISGKILISRKTSQYSSTYFDFYSFNQGYFWMFFSKRSLDVAWDFMRLKRRVCDIKEILHLDIPQCHMLSGYVVVIYSFRFWHDHTLTCSGFTLPALIEILTYLYIDKCCFIYHVQILSPDIYLLVMSEILPYRSELLFFFFQAFSGLIYLYADCFLLTMSW